MLLTTIHWNVDTSGFWDDPANWSTNSVPGPGDDVVIDRPEADVTVTVRNNHTVNTISGSDGLNIIGILSLTENASFDGPVTLTSGFVGLDVNDTLTLTGQTTWLQTTVTGSGTLTNTGTLTVTGSNGRVMNSTVTLNNSGTILREGTGEWRLDDSATINNLAGGVFELRSDSTIRTIGSNGSFNNQGLLRKTQGTGNTDVLPTRFNNQGGTIEVQSGTLTLGPGLWQNGVYNVVEGSVLSTSQTGVTSFEGTLTGSGGGEVRLGSFAVGSFAGAGATLDMEPTFVIPASSSLSGGQLTVESQVRWEGGTLGANTTLTNLGRIDYRGVGGVFINGNLVNRGVLDLAGGGGPDVREAGSLVNESGGVIDFRSGWLVVNSNTPGAGIRNAAGGVINWFGGYTSGYIIDHIVNDGLIVTQGSGTQQIFGLFNNRGTLRLTGDGNLNISFGSRFTNQVGATFEFQSDADLTGNGGGGPNPIFDNFGAVTKTGGTGVSSFGVFFYNRQSGPIVTSQSGTLELQITYLIDGDTFDIRAGARVKLNGWTTVSKDLYTGVGDGVLEFASGAALYFDSNLTPQEVTFDFPEQFLEVTGGQLVGGAYNLINIGDMRFEGDGATFVHGFLTNRGTITHDDAFTLQIRQAGKFINEGLHEIVADGDIQLFNFSVFGAGYENAPGGVLRKSGGVGVTRIFNSTPTSNDSRLDNRGRLEVLSGTVEVDARVLQASGTSNIALQAGDWHVGPFSTLRFLQVGNITRNDADVTLGGQGAVFTNLATLSDNRGDFTVSNGAVFTTAGALSNRGKITVGPRSTLTVSGAYTQTADVGSTLGIQVGGRPASNAFGRFAVNGAANLAGDLAIELVNGFGPLPDEDYTVVTYASRQGTFANITGLGSFFSANVGATSTRLNSTLSPAVADLSATGLTFPASATLGQPIAIEYTVANLTDSDVFGVWFDSFYLSADDVFNPATDPLIGRMERTEGVTALGSYTQTFNTTLPGVLDGDYRVFVVVDSRGAIPDPQRNNNRLVSTQSIQVQIPQLSFSTAQVGTIAAGEQRYYRLPSAPSGDVRILGDFQVPDQADVFLRFGELPTRVDFDYILPDRQALERALLIPSPGQVPVYLLVRGNEAAGAGQPFELSLTSVPFALREVSPSVGSNTGLLTSTVRGAGLTRDAVVELLGDTGQTLAIGSVAYVNPNHLDVTFNLTGITPGEYDVRVTVGENQATLADSLQVVQGQAGTLDVDVVMPGALRAGRVYTAYIEYANTGQSDIIAPILFISSPTATPMTLDPLAEPDRNLMRIYGAGESSTPGILRAGERVRVPIRFRANGASTIQVDYLEADSSPAMDYEGIVPTELLTQAQTDPRFDEVLDQLIAQVGPTQGDYVRMLSENASLIPEALGSPRVLADLLALEYQQALAAIGTSISGSVVSDDPRVLTAGVLITAVNTGTGQAFSTTTLNDGSFVFADVTAGQYEFKVAGALTDAQAPTTVAADQAVVDVQVPVQLAPWVEGAVLRGDGQPVPFARLFVYEGDVMVAATIADQAGRYLLSPLKAGTYDMVFSAQGMERRALTDVVVAPGQNTLDVELNQTPARITGRVTNNGQPVEAYVSARDDSAVLDLAYDSIVTGPDGTFTLDNLPAGTYQLVFIHDQNALGLADVSIVTGQQLDLGDIELTNVQPQVAAAGMAAASAAGEPGDAQLDTVSPQGVLDKLEYLAIEAELARVEFRLNRTWIPAAEYHWGAQNAGVWTLYLEGNSASPPPILYFGENDEVVAGAVTSTNFALGYLGFIKSGFQNVGRPVPGFRDTDSLNQAPFDLIANAAVKDVRDKFQSGELDCQTVHEQGAVVLSLGSLPMAGLSQAGAITKRVGDRIHFDNLGYSGLFQIPGNLAGGGNTPPGPGGGALGQVHADERWVEGVVMITPAGKSAVKVSFIVDMVAFDTVDFIPGNLGETFEPYVTRDLYMLELYDRAYDVPFEARFPLRSDRMAPVIIQLDDSECEEEEKHKQVKSGAAATAALVASFDPNDIIGPAGTGAPGHFMRPGELFPYTILFENLPAATAPAQEVRIVHTLDSSLDLDTFELGSFGFGDRRFEVPAGLDSYETRIDLVDDLGFFVDVVAGLDRTTGTATWRLTAVDPETGDFPIDALAGFLPPNQTSPEGEGFVEFTVRAKDDLATGVAIDAQARIFFDDNDPIDTPVYVNKIDAGPPSSQVTALPAQSPGNNVLVRWSGNDGQGSGIASYDIFVSANGGAFELWLDDTAATSATFTGQIGVTYGFYSVATDAAGFTEAAASSADATTLLITANVVPNVGSLAASSQPAVRTLPLTLTARNVTDSDGSVARVEFFRDANNNGVADPAEKLGQDTSAGDGFSLTLPVTWAAGQHTYLAVATDDDGAVSAPVSLVGTVLDSRTVAFGTGSNRALVFVEPDGSTVTVTVKDGLASATVAGVFTAEPTVDRSGVRVTGSNLQLADLKVTSSQGKAADLRLSVKKARPNVAPNDDGRATLGHLTVTGDAKSIRGLAIDVTGDVLVTGSLVRSDLGNFIAADQDFVINGAAAASSMKFGNIRDLRLQAAGAIRTLTANQWLASSVDAINRIAAATLGTLSNKGNFQADVALSGTSGTVLTSAKIGGTVSTSDWVLGGAGGAVSVGAWAGGSLRAPALRSITSAGDFTANVTLTDATAVRSLASLNVKGAMADAVLRTASSVGSVSAGRFQRAGVLVGLSDQSSATSLPTQAASFTNKNAVLGSLSAKLKNQSTFVDSVVAAWSMGKASLGLVQTDNGGDVFGLAGNQLKSLSAQAPDGDAVKKLTLPRNPGTLPQPVVDEADFHVQLLT